MNPKKSFKQNMIMLEELEDSVWENPGLRLTEERYF